MKKLEKDLNEILSIGFNINTKAKTIEEILDRIGINNEHYNKIYKLLNLLNKYKYTGLNLKSNEESIIRNEIYLLKESLSHKINIETQEIVKKENNKKNNKIFYIIIFGIAIIPFFLNGFYNNLLL